MKHLKKLFIVFILSISLIACSQSNEKQIIGQWKVVEDDEIIVFLEVTRENLTLRSPIKRESSTVDYFVKNTIENQFLVDTQMANSSENEFLFEGYFDSKDKIIVVETQKGKTNDTEIIRVENAAEERNKLVKEFEEKEKREKARAERRARKEKKQAAKQEKERQQEEVVMLEGNEIFMQSCAACHGEDLSGGAGPQLTDVSSNYSAEEIKDIIFNGRGAMPGGLLIDEEEIDVLIEWLLRETS